MNTILCLGNILMGDDGIGIVIGYLLKRRYPQKRIFICETDIAFTENMMDNNDNLIVIDAVNLGISPGDSMIIPLAAVNPGHLFQHDFTYNFTKKSGFLYGIQVVNTSLGIGLSRELNSKLKQYLKEVSDLF